MSTSLKSAFGVFLLTIVVSCTFNVEGNDDFVPDSEIDLIKGTANEVFDIYSDSLHSLPYSIRELSRSSDLLNIDVTYGGGEGGCPPHLFVIQWDETIDNASKNFPMVHLGLAHFIPTGDNCEALVNERLEVDLAKLLDDQLSDNLGFRVINLVDSTETELEP